MVDWKLYHKTKKHELRLFFEESKKAIWDMDDPWLKKSTGRPPYLPKGLVLCCLLKVKFKMPYREIESLLDSNSELLKLTELEKVPDHNTIQRAMAKMDEPYLKTLNKNITRHFKKTGISLSTLQDSR